MGCSHSVHILMNINLTTIGRTLIRNRRLAASQATNCQYRKSTMMDQQKERSGVPFCGDDIPVVDACAAGGETPVVRRRSAGSEIPVAAGSIAELEDTFIDIDPDQSAAFSTTGSTATEALRQQLTELKRDLNAPPGEKPDRLPNNVSSHDHSLLSSPSQSAPDLSEPESNLYNFHSLADITDEEWLNRESLRQLETSTATSS